MTDSEKPKTSTEADVLPRSGDFDVRLQNSSPERFSMFGTTFRGAEIIQSPAADDAKRHITRSLVIGGLVLLLVLILLVLDEAEVVSSLVLAGVFAYVVWASYWGIVGVMRVLTDVGASDVPDTVAAKFLIKITVKQLGLVGIIFAPIVIGIIYGSLGGGIREFLRYRKMASNPALTPK